MTAVSSNPVRRVAVPTLPRASTRTWERTYVRVVVATDAAAALAAGVVGLAIATALFGSDPVYLVEAVLTPPLWVAAIALAGGYDRRFLGAGPEEFRRVALGAFGLVAAVGITSWALDAEIARSYVFLTLPTAMILTPWVATRCAAGSAGVGAGETSCTAP